MGHRANDSNTDRIANTKAIHRLRCTVFYLFFQRPSPSEFYSQSALGEANSGPYRFLPRLRFCFLRAKPRRRRSTLFSGYGSL
ncbi:MAG: hypothetical protein BWY09_01280 [Candidatus Hydrogenedentes bacterium ADurb.Bin179]|nr:MAG: hypothetical protein BWY09_01280 [Candidatus Hydrogenedentes bacterium ADurb.Bin179]